MAKKVYNKLVRDKIPEIIKAEGKTVKTKILSNEEHLEALIHKLHEELEEFKEARNVEEMADIQEVLFAIAETLNIEAKDLASVMANKAVERGAFKKRIYLESVE